MACRRRRRNENRFRLCLVISVFLIGYDSDAIQLRLSPGIGPTCAPALSPGSEKILQLRPNDLVEFKAVAELLEGVLDAVSAKPTGWWININNPQKLKQELAKAAKLIQGDVLNIGYREFSALVQAMLDLLGLQFDLIIATYNKSNPEKPIAFQDLKSKSSVALYIFLSRILLSENHQFNSTGMTSHRIVIHQLLANRSDFPGILPSDDNSSLLINALKVSTGVGPNLGFPVLIGRREL